MTNLVVLLGSVHIWVFAMSWMEQQNSLVRKKDLMLIDINQHFNKVTQQVWSLVVKWFNKIWWWGTLDYCWRTWSGKAVKETLLLSHEVWKGPCCTLDSFLRGVLVCVDPDLVPGFVSDVHLKDCMCTISPFYHLARISKFSVSYWKSVEKGISLPQGVTRCVCPQREVLVRSPLLCERAQGALG